MQYGSTLVAAALVCASAQSQTMTLVSTASNGAQGNGVSGHNLSRGADVSSSGVVVFHSDATNLVPGDTNGMTDVFAKDLASGIIERVSIGNGGLEANDRSLYPAITPDGRFVAFSSGATNLVPGDTNGKWDDFVHDRLTHTTEIISIATDGTQGYKQAGFCSISADGRYVAFESWAGEMITTDTNLVFDVFVRDRALGTTERVSVASNGTEGNSESVHPSISADGRYVAFSSSASNFATGDTNLQADMFVHDRQTGTTERISVSSNGTQTESPSIWPSISGDGRYVAFDSFGLTLVGGPVIASLEVFVRDRQAGSTELVSVAMGGGAANAQCWHPSISADGRYVAYSCHATDVVPGDTYSAVDIVVRDRLHGVSVLASTSIAGGAGNGGCGEMPVFSPNGQYLVFASKASDLVASDTNALQDVFVLDSGMPPAAFCTAGTTTHGCVPAISSVGTASASSGVGFTISVSSVEGQKQGILFYGIDNSAFAPLPWGPSSSFLCVKQPTQRMGTQNSGGTLNACNGALVLDWNAFIAANPSALGNPFTAGQHVYAQAWFRDPPAPKTTNLSNALEFVVLQ